MATASNPLELPEILLRINSFLGLLDRISAVQVNQLWNKTIQSTIATLNWSDTLAEHELNAAFQKLCNGNIRTLECRLRHFEGKALGYYKARVAQEKLWEPIKLALIKGRGPENDSPEIQLQKWVVRGGNFIEEDLFKVLLEIKTLKHLWIDPLPGRDFTPDISKLFKVLGLPSLQTLRRLTVQNARWPNTGLPYPNNMQCQLRKIVLENTPLTDQNLMRLLESCPLLEEFIGNDVMARWSPAILNHISKVNPLLNSFVISCAPSSSGDLCNDVQVNWVIESLTVNLKTLGFYRLSCEMETLLKLQTRFKDLTRLEIYGNFEGEKIHEYLSTSTQLRHLKARESFIPVSLLQDKTKSWVCKDLLTLEVSFGHDELGPSEEQEDQIQADSKVVFEYLVKHIPNVEHLWIQKHGLSLKQGHGVELLKDLRNLKHLTIVTRTIPISTEGQNVDSEDVDVELGGLKAQLRSLSLQSSLIVQDD
ncbi:hypothetical protein BGX27_006738 [Mortierella sp. AM989]|nr:hypothetical protein BGX27_006738 [Mortierella sp. AM989]